MQIWYNDLQSLMQYQLQNTCLQALIDGLSNTCINIALVQIMAKKWWDTIHLKELGEMTMTSKDFVAMTSLFVEGKHLQFDKSVH